MDLDLGPEIARFRAELRDWIAAEAPDSEAAKAYDALARRVWAKVSTPAASGPRIVID